LEFLLTRRDTQHENLRIASVRIFALRRLGLHLQVSQLFAAQHLADGELLLSHRVYQPLMHAELQLDELRVGGYIAWTTIDGEKL